MPKDEASEAVLNYLKAQNRPFSTNDLVINLKKAFGKTAIQKALDLLVADGKVVEKVNGKQKAYVISQEDLKALNEDELASLEKQIEEKETELKKNVSDLKKAEQEAKSLGSTLTTKEALKEVQELKETISNLETRLDGLVQQEASGKLEVVSKEEKRNVEQQHESAVLEWRKRKRLCLGIINAIMETYQKPKKVFMSEVGITTDEEVGAKMPDY